MSMARGGIHYTIKHCAIVVPLLWHKVIYIFCLVFAINPRDFFSKVVLIRDCSFVFKGKDPYQNVSVMSILSIGKVEKNFQPDWSAYFHQQSTWYHSPRTWQAHLLAGPSNPQPNSPVPQTERKRNYSFPLPWMLLEYPQTDTHDFLSQNEHGEGRYILHN